MQLKCEDKWIGESDMMIPCPLTEEPSGGRCCIMTLTFSALCSSVLDKKKTRKLAIYFVYSGSQMCPVYQVQFSLRVIHALDWTWPVLAKRKSSSHGKLISPNLWRISHKLQMRKCFILCLMNVAIAQAAQAFALGYVAAITVVNLKKK